MSGLSSEMRKLQNRWNTRGDGEGWPKFLEWIAITGLRGWTGQRIEFPFPIVAIVGENSSGKSTILQAAASIYKGSGSKKWKFASDHFPDTIWDKCEKAEIKFSYKQGKGSLIKTIRKPTDRWRGNPERPERHSDYIDLSRIQPISSRVGYRRLAHPRWKEAKSQDFEKNIIARLCQIMGRKYESMRAAYTNADASRPIPILTKNGIHYSGFHHGAGEMMIEELLQVEPKHGSIVLIDEIETSLHPRAQRRLIRDLAQQCRLFDLQIIFTTHSPYVLEELPLDGRIYIMEGIKRVVIRGVSPEFAMTKMDEEPHPECEIYVEDSRAATLLSEILFRHGKESAQRCRFISYGSAQVGMALGQMVSENKFPRASCVFLDGDQDIKPGCHLMPGGDAPERVVFSQLNEKGWPDVAQKISRPPSEVLDACSRALAYSNHREWVQMVADQIFLGGDILWQVLASSWVENCLDPAMARQTIQPIEDTLAGPTSMSYSPATAQRQLY